MPWIEVLREAFRLGILTSALAAGLAVAVSCALLGPLVVLRRESMIGDGLAHVSLFSVALALILGASPLLVSIPLVVAASLLIQRLDERAGVRSDAAIGLVAASSVAAAVVLASLGGGFQVDLTSYLFGNILMISRTDVFLSAGLSILVTAVILALRRPLLAATHDPDFAQVLGLSPRRLRAILSVLTAVTVVLGIRVAGTMLVSSLIVFPALSALQMRRGFTGTLGLSVLVSVACLLSGLVLSVALNLPTGATIVLLNGGVFILVLGGRALSDRLAQRREQEGADAP